MAEIGSAVASKVMDSLFVVAKKEISYMWNCKQNVEKFKKEVEKLKNMRGRIQQQIDIAESKGDNLIHGVQEWVNTADAEILEAEEFLKQEANAKKTCYKVGLCGNWGTLRHYGKGAIKKAPSLVEHQGCGVAYENCVYVDTAAPGPLDVYENKNLDDIVTQSLALGEIIKSLEDDSIQIIGIYGLGGVGKTTLAKEVVARVKNTLFAHVAFTTVSQTPNVEKIQKDVENATKRIVKGDKILIILDDVWDKIDLENLCIPCGVNHKSCKILLTCRGENVCKKMNVQSSICVNALSPKEAWILFKRVVGEKVENDADLKAVALKVVEECGGLPLLIQAVGNALKHESVKSWNLALGQLQKHAPLDIDDGVRKAFTHLQLSYDYLKSEEVKSCFLLCSLFPEDRLIKLEDLVRYGVGLGKFDDLDSLDDARGRVQNAVNILTSSGLLLRVDDEKVEDDDEDYTKMHDVVRDVALLIASQGKNKYLVKAGKDLTEWLPRDNNLKDYTGISLMENTISKLPDYKVDFPHLEIFTINENHEFSMISDEFIEGIKEVKVLDMGRCWNAQLPQSLKKLTKLRTLNLNWIPSFHDIYLLGEMKELEILVLNGTGINKIPQEIGRLVNLRRLEVSGCEYMTHVTPDVISKLWRLEELCIDFREVRGRVYACLDEVMELSKLTYLDLMVTSFKDIPEGFTLEKLKGFVIQIGGEYRHGPGLHTTSNAVRDLIIANHYLHIPLLKWIKKTIKVSHPRISLYGIENLNNIMPTLYDEGFNKLEHITLTKCPDLSCLVVDEEKTTNEVLWKCPDEYISLTNLVRLNIQTCDKLVRLFTVRVAQGLVNLKDLFIGSCQGIKEVIYDGGGVASENSIIVFPSLATIYFFNLKNLESFFNSPDAGYGNSSIIIKYPSLVDIGIYECESMKKWGPGIHATPILKTVNDEANSPSDMNDAMEKLWRKLKQDAPDDDDEE